MEQHSAAGQLHFRNRLLIICAFIAILATAGGKTFAQSIPWRTLTIQPETEYCFTGETINFVMKIPNWAPSRIETTVQSLPANVSLLSSVEEEYTENGVRGTKITFQIRFNKSGTYKLPSVATIFDWYWYNIPFQTVTVYDNPLTLSPQFSVDVPSRIYEGSDFTLTVSGKFFLEISDITTPLNQNYLIERLHEIQLPLKTPGFDTETYNIAQYKITPLKTGKITLPPFQMAVRTYAGLQQVLATDTKEINVLSAQSRPAEEAVPLLYEDSFDDAFSFSTETDSPVISAASSEVDSEEVLHNLVEQHSMLSKITVAIIIFLAISAVLVILGFVLKTSRKTKSNLRIAGFIASGVCLVLLIVTVCLNSRRYGVCHQCNLRIIPEEGSNLGAEILEGTVVRITSESFGWLCVDAGEYGSGWIKRENCLLPEDHNASQKAEAATGTEPEAETFSESETAEPENETEHAEN
ncbi:MAG: hypothetical protein MJ183_07795 [Treponemataceae bacterium]|nr:hypothetical protein [Treponemataceae bacterium]